MSRISDFMKFLINYFWIFLLIFHAFSFAVYENDLDRCIFNILGVPRVVPKDFCNAIPQFGVKIRPREVNNFIILEGEPGCGKTTLAKSFAQATDSYCIVVRCGELSRSGVKGSASDEVARVFDIAEKHIKRCGQSVVIVFEEIDVFTKRVNNPSTNEEIEAYQTLNVRLEDHKENGKLIVFGTTNHYNEFPESVKSRCIHIKINAPTKSEYRAIFKNMLMGRNIQSLKDILKQSSKINKNLGEKLNDCILEIVKFLEFDGSNNSQHTLNQKMISANISDIDQRALEFIIKKFKNFINGFPSEVVVENQKFTKLAYDFLDKWGEDSNATRMEKVLLLNAEVKNFKCDQSHLFEQIRKTSDEIVNILELLTPDKYDATGVESLKEKTQDLKNLILLIADIELKTFWEKQFLIELDAFCKFYKLAFDESKLTALLDFECKSIRVLERLKEKLAAALKRNVTLTTEHLKKIKEEAIEAYNEKRLLPEWLEKKLEPIDEFCKKHDSTIRAVGTVSSAITTVLVAEKAAREYFKPLPNQNMQSQTNTVNTQHAIPDTKQAQPVAAGPNFQKTDASSLNKADSSSGFVASSVIIAPTPVSVSFAHDPFLAKMFPGVSEDALSQAIDQCAQNHHNRLLGSTNETSLLSGALSALNLVGAAYDLYSSGYDFYKTIKGEKDHLSPFGRYLYNSYKNEQLFAEHMQKFAEKSGEKQSKENQQKILEQQKENAQQSLEMQKQQSSLKAEELKKSEQEFSQKIEEIDKRIQAIYELARQHKEQEKPQQKDNQSETTSGGDKSAL